MPCQVAGGLDQIPFELHASIVLLAPLLLPLHPICWAVVRRPAAANQTRTDYWSVEELLQKP